MTRRTNSQLKALSVGFLMSESKKKKRDQRTNCFLRKERSNIRRMITERELQKGSQWHPFSEKVSKGTLSPMQGTRVKVPASPDARCPW